MPAPFFKVSINHHSDSYLFIPDPFQKGRKPLLAGLALAVSNFIYFWIMKKIMSADGNAALFIVSMAGGVGCWLAVLVSNQLSKDRTYVNVIMSDNKYQYFSKIDLSKPAFFSV